MSRLRLTKISQPSNPPASTAELYYDTTLSKPCIVDNSGNQIVLGGFTTKDYRLIRVTNITASGGGTYTPTTGTKALYVECIGGGGAGGGCASLTSASGAGGAGGGGAYSAVWLTGTIKASYTVNVGAAGTAGSAGNNAGGAGGDSTFDTGPSVCTAKGGSGGGGDAGHTAIAVAGAPGAGGASASGIGDIKMDGNMGDQSITLSATIAFSAAGAAGPICGSGGAPKTAQGTGNAALNYGGGGSGGVMLNAGAAVAGGAGGQGFIRVWEFA